LSNSDEEFVDTLQIKNRAYILDQIVHIAHYVFVLAELGFPDEVDARGIKNSIAILDHEFDERSSALDDLHVRVFSQAGFKYIVLDHPVAQAIRGHEIAAYRLFLLGIDECLVLAIFISVIKFPTPVVPNHRNSSLASKVSLFLG